MVLPVTVIERKHYVHFTRLLKIALKDVLQQIKTRSVEKTMKQLQISRIFGLLL